MSSSPPAVPDPGSNGSQSSRGAHRRVPPTVLGVVGVVVVALVVLGVRSAPDAGGAAVTPAAGTVSARPGAPAASPSTVAQPGLGAAPRPEAKRTDAQRATGLRADGTAAKVPAHGSGHFTAAHRSHPTSATRGRLIRFDVSVEYGLAVDADQAALLIARVLDDDRSWRGLGTGRFTLVPAGQTADVHAFLATPGTTDQLCAPLLTRGKVSCQNGSRVVLNAERWVNGAAAFGDDTTGYRRYLVNHEFGHALGHGHVGCPGRGELAPVMMQQTKGLRGCRPNSWPTRTGG
ncbi:DUF3152 domain-containing protein [uncultured Friedmanniella sp.]|uniref:DUF3152 domain-containing protein n=1 Tax=uncultured Friedmanniella sp. TaxID=335381 RepID=UPI0035C95885